MFTGIVENTGKILVKSSSSGIYWKVQASDNFLQDVRVGDSINVAGICQTVTEIYPLAFSFYSSPITLQKTTLKNYSANDEINLEKALRLGDRLGGHFVYGHVQGVGSVFSIKTDGETTLLSIDIPHHLRRFIVPAGSIAIDGVSLTVAEFSSHHCTLAVIPHTWDNTTLHHLTRGNYVNIETDPLVNMLDHLLLNPKESPPSSLKKTFKENGWL